MARFVKVTNKASLERDSCMTVQAEGLEIALYRVGDEFYATTNVCGHQGAPLGEGFLDGSIVSCPWHGWQWDVRNGTALNNPSAKITTYPVKVYGDDILVEV
jgi:nitrite reductase/ring-hydroxylating ferredoxin subunit